MFQSIFKVTIPFKITSSDVVLRFGLSYAYKPLGELREASFLVRNIPLAVLVMYFYVYDTVVLCLVCLVQACTERKLNYVQYRST